MKRAVVIAALLLTIPSAAIPRKFVFQTDVAVLVDLSATWHNASSKAYNAQLLRNVGVALGGAVRRIATPVSFRSHVIGSNSFGRPPICQRGYRSTIIAIRKIEGVETSLNTFKDYLSIGCPGTILNNPPEKLTEITATVITAQQAGGLISPGAQRLMIILSDFKEESPTRYRLETVSLVGTRVIMLWRTLPEDRRNPALLNQRVALWKQLLASRGAPVVEAYSDGAVSASPADLETRIASLLKR